MKNKPYKNDNLHYTTVKNSWQSRDTWKKVGRQLKLEVTSATYEQDQMIRIQDMYLTPKIEGEIVTQSNETLWRRLEQVYFTE